MHPPQYNADSKKLTHGYSPQAQRPRSEMNKTSTPVARGHRVGLACGGAKNIVSTGTTRQAGFAFFLCRYCTVLFGLHVYIENLSRLNKIYLAFLSLTTVWTPQCCGHNIVSGLPLNESGTGHQCATLLSQPHRPTATAPYGALVTSTSNRPPMCQSARLMPTPSMPGVTTKSINGTFTHLRPLIPAQPRHY